MTTFGYVFLLTGVLLLRQVVTGRTKETPTDAKDFVTAFHNGDMGGVSAVFSRRGENVDVSALVNEVAVDSGQSDTSTSPKVKQPPADKVALAASGFSAYGDTLVSEMQRLGSAAAGYRLAGTGPRFYDCSGLVWKAVSNIGVYKGLRFTTSTFGIQSKGWATRVAKPMAGDIVLWPKHHMGVFMGGDKLYSARSPSKGIGVSTVSGDSSYFHMAPVYYRLNGPGS